MFLHMELHLEALLALLEKSGYGTGGKAAFARIVPMSAGYLHDITSGQKQPSQKVIVAMARALQVPVQAITRTPVAA